MCRNFCIRSDRWVRERSGNQAKRWIKTAAWCSKLRTRVSVRANRNACASLVVYTAEQYTKGLLLLVLLINWHDRSCFLIVTVKAFSFLGFSCYLYLNQLSPYRSLLIKYLSFSTTFILLNSRKNISDVKIKLTDWKRHRKSWRWPPWSSSTLEWTGGGAHPSAAPRARPAPRKC